MQQLRRWAAVFVIATLVGVVVACSGGSLKGTGESCVASSECASGLVCDFGRSPSVCASMSTIAPDSPPGPDIDASDIDGGVDARPDARPDAPPDASIDAPDAM